MVLFGVYMFDNMCFGCFNLCSVGLCLGYVNYMPMYCRKGLWNIACFIC
jgi:hypothetical protein